MIILLMLIQFQYCSGNPLSSEKWVVGVLFLVLFGSEASTCPCVDASILSYLPLFFFINSLFSFSTLKVGEYLSPQRIQLIARLSNCSIGTVHALSFFYVSCFLAGNKVTFSALFLVQLLFFQVGGLQCRQSGGPFLLAASEPSLPTSFRATSFSYELISIWSQISLSLAPQSCN